MNELRAAAPLSTASADVIRVMIVDDSAVVRGLVTRWFVEQPGFLVVASCRTGRAALEEAARTDPHVAVLDIEMPDMDGVTALPLLLKAKPDLAVVMASTLTRRNADVSLRCLALGAADCLAKPGAIVGRDDYKRDLVAKVRALGEAVRRRSGVAPAPRRTAAETLARVASGRFDPPAPAVRSAPGLRPFSTAPVRAIVIGASTGGPPALMALFRELGPAMAHVTVIVTQHMPATFTAALADTLGQVARRPAREAAHGEPLVSGEVYVAPGGRHLSIALVAGRACAAISDGPPENFCKPSVDPLFRSAAQTYGAGLLGVMLTGMGADGAGGVRAISAGGGSIIAQDEASSVVWGMPGAAVATGCCSAVLPLAAIGPKIVRIISGERA